MATHEAHNAARTTHKRNYAQHAVSAQPQHTHHHYHTQHTLTYKNSSDIRDVCDSSTKMPNATGEKVYLHIPYHTPSAGTHSV